MNQRLFHALCLTSLVSGCVIQPALAQIAPENSKLPRLRDVDHPAMTVKEWVAQIESSGDEAVVQVTAVQLKPTEKGLEVILETAGEFPEVLTSSAENSLITDIPNAQLRLPEGREFRQDNPTNTITAVRVENLDAKIIRVTVTGKAGIPTAEVSQSPQALILSVAAPTALAPQPTPIPPLTPALPAESQKPTAPEVPVPVPQAEEERLELTVRAEEEVGGYNVPDATTATKTDTPIRDIPQSIQVIPREVLDDQQVIRLGDALRNVSGVQQGFSAAGGTESFVIRGFSTFTKLRNGFREEAGILEDTANVERVEVLKGPASVLYGNLDPGGVVNTVTKLPLEEPFYSIGFQAGSFGLIRPTIDLTGPLNAEGTVLYRLNAAYEKDGNFRDFIQGIDRLFISPVLTWEISDRTSITFDVEYLKDTRPFDRGLVAIGTGVADIPFDRVLGELDDVVRKELVRAGYRLEHRFSDNWILRNAFSFFNLQTSSRGAEQAFLGVDEQTGELGRIWSDSVSSQDFYGLQTDLIGKFETGSVKHTLLLGIDLSRSVEDFDGRFDFDNPTFINIFNPIYGQVPRPPREQILSGFASVTTTDRLGIYLQDQITLAENLKLLIGGRFDRADQESVDRSAESETEQQDTAFTPRVGIVYQPIPPISLYTSFSQSFQPNSGTQADLSLLPPERGTQYEVGVKGEFLNGKLVATLAAFQITKSNVSVTDPNNPDFSLPIGEQRSRGIELDMIGEIFPGWNIVANYAYTDATVTDNSDSVIIGNRLYSVPYNSASLWTTYQIQVGSLQGLGFGVGLFYVGEREGDLFESGALILPSYLRTDASLFYRRNNWQIAINVQNLFDVNYIKETSDVDRITPGAPFTVIGRFSVEF